MTEDRRLHGSHKILFVYWFVLVLWQNIGGQQARSSMDMIIKLGLIGVLSFYFLARSLSTSTRFLGKYLVLLASVMMTYFIDPVHTTTTLISYVFPSLFVLLTYGVGGNQRISIDEYLTYIHWMIYVVLYMIFYSFVFKTSHFTNLNSLTTAYGNELSSFLTSNLEYGMYLTFAVIGCLICLHFEKDSPYRRVFYYIVIGLCFINLLFSFSRTSIIASLAAVMIYAISANKKSIPFFVGIAMIALLTNNQIPAIRNFITNIVFKGGTASGRDSMMQIALAYYSSESTVNKLFGLGYGNGGDIIRGLTNHGSLHNGFIQLLFLNGAFGLAIVVVFLASNIISAMKLIKIDTFLGGIFLALSFLPIIFMMTCTAIVFYSSIDSAMLTIFTIILPHYVKNEIKDNYYNL